MAPFKSKFPAYVREAVVKAVADGLQPRAIMAGLADGSLDGLGGKPWPLGERTMRRYIASAREQIKAGGYKAPEPDAVLIDGTEKSWEELSERIREVIEEAGGLERGALAGDPQGWRAAPDLRIALRFEDGEIKTHDALVWAMIAAMELDERRKASADAEARMETA